MTRGADARGPGPEGGVGGDAGRHVPVLQHVHGYKPHQSGVHG